MVAVGALAYANRQEPLPVRAVDPSAAAACSHFRNIMGDVSDGILTPVELRTKLQEVNDTARRTNAPDDIQTEATAMVAAATADNGNSLTASIGRMDTACTAAGT